MRDSDVESAGAGWGGGVVLCAPGAGAGSGALSVDQASMAQLLSDFSRSLTEIRSADLVLDRLCRVAMDVLPVDGTGVMLINSGRPTLVAASSAATAAAEAAQQLEEDSLAGASARAAAGITVDDLMADTTWPRYSTAAVDAGFRSVAAVPLVARDMVWGVLDLYRTAPQQLDWTALVAAQALADLATVQLLVDDDRRRAAVALDEMSHRALHDHLTGLANRALFSDRLEHALASRTRHWSPVVVMFVDLDGFKEVNDTYGHVAGDLVLQEVTRRFGGVVRVEDTLARLGGDEFAVLSSSFSPEGGPTAVTATANLVALRLVESLDDPFEVLGQQVRVSASVGVAVAGPDQESAAQVLAAADAAMYRSKQQRPGTLDERAGTVALARRRTSPTSRPPTSPAVTRPIRTGPDPRSAGPGGEPPRARVHRPQARSRLTTELRRAAPGVAGGQGQFQLLYQPVVALRPGTGSRPPRQLEALLRWEHPTRGLLAPADFLQTAEDSGLIVEIGASVLQSACAVAGAWQDEGVHSSVAVNVSAAELRSPGFVDRVAAAMELAGIEPSWLRLEITENSLLEPAGAVVATVAGLRSLGVGLSLDDFGTGFSSLTHLERFPVDAIKIDRSFVGRLGDDIGAGIVAGVLALARALELEVVAEGVETPGQLAQLRALGCDYAQGFLLGRPDDPTAILGGAYPDVIS